MRICKVKPDSATCHACVETQEMFGVVDDCGRCDVKIREYELVKVGVSFWVAYALVMKDGVINKVSLNRVYDIREIKND